MMSIRTIACALAVVAAPALAPAVARADPGVKVENAAARMVVVPEARADVRVDVQAGDTRLPMPVVRREGDQLIVEGGLQGRIGSCGTVGVDMRVFHGGRGEPNPRVQRVFVRGIGPLTLDRLPVITAHVPMRASISAGDAVFGRIGRTERLALANSGCGDWTVDDVQGDFSLAGAGSGDVQAGRIGTLHEAFSGSGDLIAGDIGGDMDLAVHGSSDTKVGRVGGRLRIDLAGSGDLHAREVDGAIQSQQSGSGGVGDRWRPRFGGAGSHVGFGRLHLPRRRGDRWRWRRPARAISRSTTPPGPSRRRTRDQATYTSAIEPGAGLTHPSAPSTYRASDGSAVALPSARRGSRRRSSPIGQRLGPAAQLASRRPLRFCAITGRSQRKLGTCSRRQAPSCGALGL